MKSIQSKDDFLAWAREINQGVSLSRKCDLQDVYAHSKVADIDKFFIECNGDRKLIICSVNNCMAFEEVERLLTVLAKHKVNEMVREEQAELDKSWREVADAQGEVGRLKSKVAELETRINVYQVEVARINKIAWDYQVKANEYRINSEKFDTLKSLLQ